MNTSQLQTPPATQVQRIVKDGEDTEADFLALRLLNKQARVRLSPEPLQYDSLPGKGALLAVANEAGYFAAATRNSAGSHSIVFSSLASLRSAFAATSSDDADIPFSPSRSIPVDAQPTSLVFASNESKLVVGLASGSIAVYDVQTLCGPDAGNVAPGHVFASTTGTSAREMLANPADLPDLVAVLYEPSAAGHRVEILDVRSSQVTGAWTNGSGPNTVPTCLSWSPKGKQLAIGLQSGDIVTYSPNETSKAKLMVPRPSSSQALSVISLSWLTNTEFHGIYAPAGTLTAESEQIHVLISLDAKSNKLTETKLSTPYLPIPGLRPPGAFRAVLRQWEPSKFLLFIGDGTSSDIGLLGSSVDPSGQELWANLSLEETSTPSMPLDKDMNETVMLGMSLDLTGTEEFMHKTASGEDLILPPPPVMYVYVSDGTVIGWNVLNTRAIPYPGMVKPSTVAETGSDPMETAADAGPPTPVFAVQNDTPAASPPAGSTQSPQPSSAFGQSSFGQAPAFAQPAFGGAGGFGQTSAFGSSTPSSSIATLPAGGGFGAFAQPSGFGGNSLTVPATMQTPSSPAMPSPMAISMSTSMSEDPMSADTESGSGFSGMSLGSNNASGESSTSKSGIFGSFAAPAAAQPAPTLGNAASPGDSSSILKPAIGFGAFANQTTSTFSSGSFSTPPASADAAKPVSSAFGSTGFGAAKPATSSAFGQSGFGASGGTGNSAFGKPGFGQTSFGQSFGASSLGSAAPKLAFGAPSIATPATGGFASFASGGSVFGKSAIKAPEAANPAEGSQPSDAKPEPAAAAPSEVPQTPTKSPAFGASDENTPKASSSFGASASPGTSERSGSATITPAASPFKTSSAPSPGGAFAGLTAHPTGFGKIDAGHGAFGVPAISASSPFLNPKTPTNSAFGSPVSAFPVTPTTPKAPGEGTSKPAFGAPSAFGAAAAGSPSQVKSAFGSSSPIGSGSAFGKSVFGTPPVTPPKPAVASTGVFSAFAGGSGFGAFSSGGNKSFSDLLRGEKGGDAKSQTQDTPPSTPTPTKSQPQRTSVFGVPLKDKAAERTYGGGEAASRDSKADSDGSDDEADEGGVPAEDDDDAISFLSQSFSEDEDEEEEDEEDEDEDEEDLEEVEIPRSPKEGKDDTHEATEEEKKSVTPEPANKPPLSSQESPAVADKATELVKDDSTTPPGSPDKTPAPVVASPAPTSPSPAAPFTLGLGRPSTKPTRSSPLANTPISGDDRDEDDNAKASADLKGKQPEVVSRSSTPAQDSKKEATPPLIPKAESSSGLKPPLALPTFAPPKPNPFVIAPSNSSAATPSLPIGLFGQKPATATDAVAPKTGTLGSVFPAAPSTRPPLVSAFSAPTPVSSNKDGPSAPPFSLPSLSQPSSPAITFNVPPAGLFGQKPAAAPASPLGFAQNAPTSVLGLPSAPATPSPFGQKPASPAPATASPATLPGFSLGRTSSPSTVPSSATTPATPTLFGKPAATPATSPVPPTTRPDPLAHVEEGMQKECINLVLTIMRESDTTKQLALAAEQRRASHYKSLNISRTTADLKDSTKFGIADSHEFSRLLKTLHKELADMKELRAEHTKALRELESAMLKVTMRKEEVVRFSKAKDDSEFAKMLKARSLGPEHLETQIQLRRGVRVIRDRIQKLEDHMQLAKKRLSQLKGGKPGLRAPSLDTLNKAYRNIDIAIKQQTDGVDRLTARVAKLKLDPSPSPRRLAGRLSAELRDKTDKSVVRVTPNVAVTTAAALNAERAAQRLKGALLRVRKAPMLNTQAVGTPAPAFEFSTPQKPQPPAATSAFSLDGLSFATSSPGPSGLNASATSLPQTPQWDMSMFQTPESPGSPTPSTSPGLRQRGSNARSKHHAPPVAIKRSPGAQDKPTDKFNWGPLPGITPMAQLSADVRKKDKDLPGTKSGDSMLSASWVTEGFGVKK